MTWYQKNLIRIAGALKAAKTAQAVGGGGNLPRENGLDANGQPLPAKGSFPETQTQAQPMPAQNASEEASSATNGPAMDASLLRRQSPHHTNPEDTTIEGSLNDIRHQPQNHPLSPDNGEGPSMASLEGAQGGITTKGDNGKYDMGKGATLFNDTLPSDQSFAK
jgi:hypothetical protein